MRTDIRNAPTYTFFVTVRYCRYYNLDTWAIIFFKPGDFADISASKVLGFVQSAGLLNAEAKDCLTLNLLAPNTVGARINP
jgi:alkyl hydroperoxide reductase subunit AhpC